MSLGRAIKLPKVQPESDVSCRIACILRGDGVGSGTQHVGDELVVVGVKGQDERPPRG